jgi:hypothetical protein
LALVKIAKYRFDLVHTFGFCHLDPIFEDQGGGILRMYPHFQGGQTFRKVINIQGGQTKSEKSASSGKKWPLFCLRRDHANQLQKNDHSGFIANAKWF